MPPGRSTLIIALKQMHVVEKSKPGRMLRLDKITRPVFSIGDNVAGRRQLEDAIEALRK